VWVTITMVMALGCNTKASKDEPGLVSTPEPRIEATTEVAVDPGPSDDGLEAEPTQAIPTTGHWTVAPPAGCRLGRAKLRTGGLVKAKMKAALKARSALAMMAQSLIDEVRGDQATKPTVEARIDENGKGVRVVTTTTANINLVGVRQIKSRVEKETYTAMFCLNPKDVTASFRQMDGLVADQQAALVAKAEKAYGGLAAALAGLEADKAVGSPSLHGGSTR